MPTYFNQEPRGFSFNIGMTPGIKLLLIVNIVVFMITSFQPGIGGPLGLTPAIVVKGAIWQLFTYQFLHAGIGHILFNMLSLWMFGTAVEGAWGQRRFLRFYLTCGTGAGLCVLMMAYIFGSPGERLVTTVGASGAIYAVLMAFGIMYPNAPVLLFFLFPVPARWAVVIFGAIAFFGFSGGGGTISHIAHLGGLLVGYIYMRSSGLGGSPYTGYRRPAWSRWTRWLTRWFSWEEWRIALAGWRRRRLRKKFDVYMRQTGGERRDRDDYIQ